MRDVIEFQWLRYFVVVLFSGLLAGCASTSETTTLQENLSILNERQAAIETRLQSTEGASQRGGDLYARIEELQTRMRNLNGKIEELEHKLDLLQRAQASAAQAPQPAPPSPGAVVIEEAQPPQPARTQPQTALASSPPPPGEAHPQPAPVPSTAAQNKSSEQMEFDGAVQLMHQKKYEAARKQFQGFVSKFPRSDLDESAMYEIGESYFLEKRYEDAIKAYQQVLDKYPKGAKTASVLLKQAMGWQNMGETTMARIIYTRLVEKYPGSS
ncbi:MAG: tol-pal system protein YbgF, partial [Syntrophobacteraceae bacterium]